MAVTCKECNKHFPKAKKLCNTHLKKNHDLTLVQYERKHGQYSILDINERPTIDPAKRVECLICGFEFTSSLAKHLKIHSITTDEYSKQYGDPFSKLERERRRTRMQGDKNPIYGRGHTAETKSKIAETVNAQFANGRQAANKGVKLSPDKDNISSSKKS